MKRYWVRKNTYEKGIVADYGFYSNYDDVKCIVKGWKLDKELKGLFDMTCYTRKNSKIYYEVIEMDY